MSTHELLRERLCNKAGIPLFNFDELQTSEWSSTFESLMRRRLILGALRYGKLRAEGKRKYDRVASMHKRLELYEATGNLEHLVDVANIAMCEYEESTHKNAHFAALDEPAHHTKAR